MKKVTVEEMDRLLNQKEVAEILGVSTKTLEYWRWKNIGPKFYKIGKLARYKESEVRLYIDKMLGGGEVQE